MDDLHKQLEKYKRGLETEKDFASVLYCSLQIERIEKQIAAQHCVHADEKPATVNAALRARNILSRFVGWLSAFRR